MARLQLIPNGAGDYTNIASQNPDADEHWDKVDDAVGSPDDAATTVYTLSTPAQEKDAYALENHTTEDDIINWVKVCFRCRGQTAYDKAQPYLRLGVVETAGTDVFIAQTFTTYCEELARPGGGNWSWADIDNLQVAIGLTGHDGQAAICTQIYVVVDHGRRGPGFGFSQEAAILLKLENLSW